MNLSSLDPLETSDFKDLLRAQRRDSRDDIGRQSSVIGMGAYDPN